MHKWVSARQERESAASQRFRRELVRASEVGVQTLSPALQRSRERRAVT
jgi:hypothetical protein